VPTTALVLVLGSAVVHAYWNLLYKQAKDKQAFPVFKSLGSWVIMALLGAIWWTIEPPTSLEFIPLAVLSGACYAGYFVFMSAAYERGDLSVVYPISRGVGPALAAVGGYFVLHERLTAMGVAGIGLILLAVVVISAGSSRDESAKAASPVAGALFAVLVGVMIAIYGVSDKVGVGIVHPFIFLMFGIGVSLTILLPWQLWRYGTARMAAGWREEWRLYMGCAALDTSSYLLYLFALRLANTAYVTPLRSVSVILAAIAGVTLLKESQGPVRVGAAVVVVAGALLITTMG
jgi:drug/metabolite transporter (DMT)-like permease